MLVTNRGKSRTGAVALFFFAAAIAFAANITVPSMELTTHGSMVGKVLALQTYGAMVLQVDGGYKLGGSVQFGLPPDSTNLEGFTLNPDGSAIASLLPVVAFTGASVDIRQLFGLPIDLSYFVGQNDVLASGSGFDKFGAGSIGTGYRGFIYFPTGPLYDGIYQVQGTGLRVALGPGSSPVAMDLYVYEDTHNPPFPWPGVYSVDARVLLNTLPLKLEAFVGATSTPPFGLWRAGLLFYAANANVEFLSEIGVPLYDPNTDTIGIDLFYLLVEPRLHLGLISIVPTFFWHPGAYLQEKNPSELGTFDVNLNLYAGDPAKTSFSGGLEGSFSFKSSTGDAVVKASPWFGFLTPGVQWKLKVNARLWPFDLSNLVDGFVGVQAAF